MDFFVDKNTALPFDAQIQEQIKLALLVGVLTPGDRLPSIRELAKHIGVNRGVVYKAYMQLEKSGILSLQHGHGVVVESHLNYDQRHRLSTCSEELSQELVRRLYELGICPSAFARYLYRKARESERQTPFIIFVDATHPQASEHAARISSLWQVPIQGFSLEELAAERKQSLKMVRKILTTYLRVDDVTKILGKSSAQIIPIRMTVKQATKTAFKKFPIGSSVILIMDNQDYPKAPFFLEIYRRRLLPSWVEISAKPLGQIKDLKGFLRRSDHQRFIFSTRVWEQLPDEMKNDSRVLHPEMDIELSAVESARIRAGLIL